MSVGELQLKRELKCTCSSCDGTGIYKLFSKKEDVGVICTDCNGLGYQVFTDEKNEIIQFGQDKFVYQVEQGAIEYPVKLFTQLVRRNDIHYVIHSTSGLFQPEHLFDNGTDEMHVIKYEDFYNGVLPMPIIQQTCPRQLSLIYGNSEFDNDCPFGCFLDCKKFGEIECWDKFYGNAKTIEEKQAVLKKIK
ncbi:MAG: hypothetical protein PHN72_03235 [Bacilli bacterium]|nr:hypothetical protein [Bacilli bacterium]